MAPTSYNTVFQLRVCRRSVCLKDIKEADSGRHINSPKIRAIYGELMSGTQQRYPKDSQILLR